MALDRPVVENVLDIDATFGETPSDEQATVAGQRLVLAAHQHKTAVGGQFLDPIEPRDEERVRGHLFVIGWPAAPGASPELDAQKQVCDAAGVEPSFQSGATEMWIARRG
ncbi:MAG: hypothetical protein WA733_13195 [Methylocystis sp.]